MDFRPPRPRRRAVAALVSGIALAGGGAALVLAWQAGWGASLFGVALCLSWTLGLSCWSALHRDPPGTIAVTQAVARETAPLSSLLDQVPVPLVRADAAGAHAINRAARTLFATDGRILPAIPALLDPSGGRVRHEGRSWRIDAVTTTLGHRLLVLIDADAEERAAIGRTDDEMIDIVGHELLNGLSPIVSLADSAVTAAANDDPMLSEILATLARRVEGLEGFTRAYRTLSRLPDPVPTPVALDSLTDDLARLFSSRFGPSVTLAVAVPPARFATFDRDQLTQALWALLHNAAEAALAGSRPCEVGLDIMAEDGKLTIGVRDTGTRIALADRARVFRPFFTTKPQGSGVGLSLARRIARAHGGDLQLRATSTTQFVLHIPLRQP
jgi:signal transduction histidine kinase